MLSEEIPGKTKPAQGAAVVQTQKQISSASDNDSTLFIRLAPAAPLKSG